MAETSTNLGRVSLVPRGEYDPTAQYRRLDIVSYNGSSYLALRNLQGVTPADGADYMLIARAGEDGAPGADGADGAPGNSIAGIERTSGTGAAGTTDTYTITMTDGSAYTFQVYNGADGSGTGDMIKSTYDPQGKSTDVFAYADEGLALKQPLLAGQPGQVVGFDADGAAVAHQADAAQVSYDGTQSGLQAETVQGAIDALSVRTARVSNPNLLDNWCFLDPVNQIGHTEYTSSGYTIDRWYFFSDSGKHTLLVEDGYISLVNGSGNNSWIRQCVEDDFESGCQLTISALFKADAAGRQVALKCSNADNFNQGKIKWFTAAEAGTLYLISFTVTPYTHSSFEFIASITNESVTNLLAMKVEFGSVQTLAHKEGDTWVLNDPPPDKALELLKCQRYYQVFATQSLRPTKAEDFRPPMRTTPALGTIVIDGVTYYTADANL